MLKHPIRRSRYRSRALAVLACCAVGLVACGGQTSADGDQVDGAKDVATAYVEPEYAGLPADLTPEQVCALLDEEVVAGHLEAEVNGVRPGSRQPDCQWLYKLDGGPATSLQVQVMSMEHTGERLGSDALKWALGRAPEGSEVTTVDGLDVPHGSYQFGVSTVVVAVDPSGRVFTVSAHSETAEQGRLAVVQSVLAALTEKHS